MQINNGIYIGRPNVSSGPPLPNISLFVRPNSLFNISEYVGTSDSDFTIEWFQKMTTDSSNSITFDFGNNAHAVNIEGGNFNYFINSGIVKSFDISGLVYIDTWVTFCVMRKSDNIYFFMNGINISDPLYFSYPITVTGMPLYIGSQGDSSLFNGRLSNFRFTNGESRYNISGYVPATAPLDNTGPTVLLLLQGESLALELTDNAINNVVVNGTGIYDISNPFAGYQGSIYFGPLESYNVYNCPNEETNYTVSYPVGNFVVGDRVLINEGNRYGFINSTEPADSGDNNISSLPIGYVDFRCYDSNINLSAVLGGGEAEGEYFILLNGAENLGQSIPVISDIDLDYEITVRVHYDCAFNNGESDLYRNGYVDVITNTYNIPGGGTATLNGEGTFAFTTPVGYDLVSFGYYMNPLTIKNTYGPYNTGYDWYNSFVTDNGNAWKFYWPQNL